MLFLLQTKRIFMNDNTATIARGMGLLGFLFSILLTMKLMGVGMVATWSWWTVTAPIWTPILAIILASLLFVLFLR